ncbi:hypothetical protein [Streptomyces sp. NPDC127066]|uniref:hypothetical protein n=1 Tax=Streptomyces sp. NPDC127066 TaxID=3347125 RepID=UPI003660FC05
MTSPAHSWRRSTRAVLSGVLLLGGLVACGGDEPASPSAPEVFYVRPYGDKSRPSNETVFQLGVKGGAQTTTSRRLTMDVPRDSQDAVRLRIMIEDCKGSTTHATCEVRDMSGDWYGAGHLVPVAAKGSEAGDSGVLRITYTTADGKKLTASTRIVVGEPVVLPGSHGAKRILRVVVRNNGPGDPGRSTRMVFSPPVGSEVLEQPMYEVDNGEYGPYCESKDLTYICDLTSSPS